VPDSFRAFAAGLPPVGGGHRACAGSAPTSWPGKLHQTPFPIRLFRLAGPRGRRKLAEPWSTAPIGSMAIRWRSEALTAGVAKQATGCADALWLCQGWRPRRRAGRPKMLEGNWRCGQKPAGGGCPTPRAPLRALPGRPGAKHRGKTFAGSGADELYLENCTAACATKVGRIRKASQPQPGASAAGRADSGWAPLPLGPFRVEPLGGQHP